MTHPNVDMEFTEIVQVLALIYLIAKLLSTFMESRYAWDCFTRVVSTLNATNCCVMVYHEMSNNSDVWQLYGFPSNYATLTLLSMAAYLCVDGFFQLFDFLTEDLTAGLITSVVHHVVGGYGIYLIASTRMGLGLGLYFAMTEFSTPILNLSWYLYINKFHKCIRHFFFGLFYLAFTTCRILTIPALMMYIGHNEPKILELSQHYQNMVYYGSYTLMGLNLTWFTILTGKMFAVVCGW